MKITSFQVYQAFQATRPPAARGFNVPTKQPIYFGSGNPDGDDMFAVLESNDVPPAPTNTDPLSTKNLYKGSAAEKNELDMPEREEWLKRVNFEAMNTALDKANVNYLMKLKTPQSMDYRKVWDVVDIGTGYADFLFQAIVKMHRNKQDSTTKIKALGIDNTHAVIEYLKYFRKSLKLPLDPNDMGEKKPLNELSTCVFEEYNVLDQTREKKLKELVLDDSVRLVILSSMLHKDAAQKNIGFLREAERMLMPGGRILITHWFHGYPKRGPPDELRLPPEETVLYALKVLKNFEFIGYQKLSEGMFCCVLQKPQDHRANKLNLRALDEIVQNKNKQISPSIFGHVNTIFKPLYYLSANTPAQKYAQVNIFWNGLVQRFIEDNKPFVDYVNSRHQKDPKVKEEYAVAVKQFDTLMRDFPIRKTINAAGWCNEIKPPDYETYIASLKEQCASDPEPKPQELLKEETAILKKPIQYSVRRRLMILLLVFIEQLNPDKKRAALENIQCIDPFHLPMPSAAEVADFQNRFSNRANDFRDSRPSKEPNRDKKRALRRHLERLHKFRKKKPF